MERLIIKKFVLGITDKNVVMQESDGGNVFAF